MRKIYFYLFFCFYSTMLKKDSEKLEGATSLISILFISITFSLYFFSHVLFNLKFYYPLLEVLVLVIASMFIWYLNRKYLIIHKNGEFALLQNQDKNKLISKILGFSLTIAQLALFICSGIITSKYVWQW